MPMTPARRRRFQPTTRTNAGRTQRVITRGFEKGSLCSSREAPAPRSLPTIAARIRGMLWTDGRYIWQVAQELDGYRTFMWDRLLGTVLIQDWREGELPSRIRRRLQLVSDLEQDGRGDGETHASRWPDADLIDGVWSRTACRGELTCAAVLCPDSILPGLAPTSLPPTNTLTVSNRRAYGRHPCGARRASLLASDTPGRASLGRSEPRGRSALGPCLASTPWVVGGAFTTTECKRGERRLGGLL
jgi:hypothetical protein